MAGVSLASLGCAWQTSRITSDEHNDPAGSDRLRLDPDTIERGRAHIAQIRARLSGQSPPVPTGRHEPGTSSDEAASVDVDAVGEWSTERMSAEMAASAERERLIRRNEQLERENAHLRASLAAVIAAASDGIRPATDEEPDDQSGRIGPVTS